MIVFKTRSGDTKTEVTINFCLDGLFIEITEGDDIINIIIEDQSEIEQLKTYIASDGEFIKHTPTNSYA